MIASRACPRLGWRDTVRQFWFGLVIGVVIGAVGAMIYSEMSSAPDEAAAEETPANQT